METSLDALLVATTQTRGGPSAIEQVRVRMLPDGRMGRGDAALYLGHQPKTLAMWALQGKGPRSLKVGGRVFYFKDDLDAFIRGCEAALVQHPRQLARSCPREWCKSGFGFALSGRGGQ